MRVKQWLKSRYGFIPLIELRNKTMYGHTAPRLHAFERAEARRIGRTLPAGRFPSATVATIIPTYRRPVHVVKAVESALAQTFTNQVIVVIDDGAGLTELPRDPRVHGISLSRNTGVAGVNRNIGMRLTDSPFVAFLDDDNTWQPNHLEVALARFDRPDPPDGVYTAMRRVTPAGAVLDVISQPFDRNVARNQGFLDVSTFVVRRSPAVRYSRIRRAKHVVPKEDWELMWRYTRRHRIEHIPDLTVDYLVNPDSYWTAWTDSQVSASGG
jgi:glycosyltransferase involved in cell wall biosynthesis